MLLNHLAEAERRVAFSKNEVQNPVLSLISCGMVRTRSRRSTNEDCLYLNVFTTSTQGSKRARVS